MSVFWRYWTGSTISAVGDAVTAVALPLTAVTVLHASSFEISLITAATYAAWVVIGLPAGVLVERLPLRGTQVVMDLVRAAALASIPLAAWQGVLSLGQLVAVALVVSCASVIFDVGNSTLLPAIVAKDELTSRNSLNSASHSVTMLGGPALGGILVQVVGAAASLLVDAVSYLTSAVLLWSLPRPARPTTAVRREPMIRSIKQGWHFVVRHPVIRPCVLDATAINFACGGLMALTPVFLVRTLGASPAMVGVLIATEGLGSLVGASLTPRIVARFGSARAVIYGAFAASLLSVLMPLAGTGAGMLLFAVGNAGFAGGVVVTSIVTRTHRQTVTPPELLPRVMATVRFVSWGAIPVGALVAGVASSLWGVRAGMALACGVTFLSPLAVWLSPIRRVRELTDVSGQQSSGATAEATYA